MTGLPIVGLRPLSGRTGTTLLMNLLGTSSAVAFDRRHPAEYRIVSYLVHLARSVTEPFDGSRHPGVTELLFGPQPAWGPLPFASDAIDVAAWGPELLRSMWSSASVGLMAKRPGARWYAEKLAVDDETLRTAGLELVTIDVVRDPRDVLASRRAFLAGGTESWARDATTVAAELAGRLDDLDTRPAALRVRYEDLVADLAGTAVRLGRILGVDLDPEAVGRPAEHVTTPSAAASVGRWRVDLPAGDARALAPVAERLGYTATG